MVWWQGLNVSFVDAELAKTCNSRAEVERRWGKSGIGTVGRRLIELSASVDLGEVATLPGATVEHRNDGSIEIVFRPDGISVTCRLDAERPDCLRVSALCLAQEVAR